MKNNMRNMIFALTLLSLLCLTSLQASEISQKVYAGPEIYHVKRIRSGGSFQNGVLYGGRFGWERIKRNSVYLCLTAVYAKGDLNGQTGIGSTLFSHFTDFEGQARLGYTLKTNKGRKGTLIPFLGCGAVSDTNHFVEPSPFTVQFHDFVKYISAGFLAELKVNHCFSAGLNFTLKWMIKGSCNTSADSGASNSQLLMTNQLQYEVDLPLTYALSKRREVFTLSLVPFYQFRHYGGRENFPYDFLATKFDLYGARLLLNYQF